MQFATGKALESNVLVDMEWGREANGGESKWEGFQASLCSMSVRALCL